jgi:5'-methylthioadenosine phosphorylase
MKLLGVEWIIGVSAVGSLQKDIERGNFVLVDQFIDKTVQRQTTFFGDGVVGHAGFGEPVCSTLRGFLASSITELGYTMHETGTYVNMEGPQFSSRAESELHRSWGASVIGMTVCAEAKLAKEAEISYAVLAMATDYDCWKTDEEPVSVAAVVATLTENNGSAQAVIAKAIPLILGHTGAHPLEGFMATAIMTSPDKMPASTKAKLKPIIGKYFACDDWVAPSASGTCCTPAEAASVDKKISSNNLLLVAGGLALAAVMYFKHCK